MQEFDLQGKDYIELNNLLKITGLCNSGGVAKLLISEGLIEVDGEVELRKRCKIRSGQTVTFEDQTITVK